MPNQQVDINGHNYQLWGAEYAVNCDYIVELEPTQPPTYVVGKLMWIGNGETNFDYKAFDVYGETLGIFATWSLAMLALDAKIYGA